MKWGRIHLIKIILFSLSISLYGEVERASSLRQFDRIRRHNKMVVVFLYTHDTAQGKFSKNFKDLQQQMKRFYRVSERDRYMQTGIKFVIANLSMNNLNELKKRYGIKNPATILLFYRKSLYSNDRLEGLTWTRTDLENIIDDNFNAFIQANLEKKEQKVIYNPSRNTIYEFGRPMVYAGPTWGYYYSPTACDPYWYPNGWYGCGGPRFGFGFSIGV